MDASIVATLAITSLLALERLAKNCLPNWSCTGMRHANFQCSKCLTADMDFGSRTPPNTPPPVMTPIHPLSRHPSNELKELPRRMSLDELRKILEVPEIKLNVA